MTKLDGASEKWMILKVSACQEGMLRREEDDKGQKRAQKLRVCCSTLCIELGGSAATKKLHVPTQGVKRRRNMKMLHDADE